MFELDQPVNIERKHTAVTRALGGVPASVRLLAVDFEHEDAIGVLLENGFRDTGRTLFIWEGVTQYLRPDTVAGMFDQLRQAAPGSRLIFSYIRQDFIDGTDLHGAQALYRRFRQRSQLWKSGFVPESVEDTLREYGWRVIEQAGPSYYRDQYIRPTGRRIAASPIEWTALAVRTR